MARLGYMARGAVYVLIGAMSLRTAFNGGAGATDSRDALVFLSGDGIGVILLTMIAAGLLAFAIWRAIQAGYDVDHHGWTSQGIAIRGGMVGSSIIHLMLAFYSATLTAGYGTASDGSDGMAEFLIRQLFGNYLLGIAAMGMFAASMAMVWKGIKKNFLKYLHLPTKFVKELTTICAFGLVARGVIFGVTASFFMYAALTIDPDEAGGLAEAMLWIRQQPYGSWLFSIAALGLLAFGLYGFIEAIWRRIDAAMPEEHIEKAMNAFRT